MSSPILWVAMETTGVGEGGDFSAALPTEISTLVTSQDFEPLGGSSDAVTLTKAHAKVLKANPEALQFLKARGAIHTGETFTLDQIEDDILAMLEDLGIEKGRVMVAGRGAAHFLLPVIQTHMPRLADFVAFYSLDTSQMTRWMRVTDSTDRLRSHRVKAPGVVPLLKSMHGSTRDTLREVLTEALQFRAVMRGTDDA